LNGSVRMGRGWRLGGLGDTGRAVTTSVIPLRTVSLPTAFAAVTQA
jgi:hypothetical protein